jgi:N,N'-diacetyllegionaminate synthase
MEARQMEINGRRIGGGASPYLIAEIGINHGGDLETARRLLLAAQKAGVDAAKLQVFVPSEFLARSSPYYDILARCALGREDVRALMGYAREIGLTLFSAVFDQASADLLNELRAPAFKIASGDLTHLPLLRHVAGFGKPMIVSTGGATVGEIGVALDAIYSVAADLPVALLHCISHYPTEPADANLSCMTTMRAAFRVPVGFSDHTLCNTVAAAAGALGADLIEKHFTYDRNAEGPDHASSADPRDMAALAHDLAVVHAAVGRAHKTPVESPNLIPQFRRSVTAAVDIPAGTAVTAEMLAVKRPGTGIAPADLQRVIGRTAKKDVRADTTLNWDSFV